MALPTLNYDFAGNTEIVDAQRLSYNAMTNVQIPAATQPYIITGTGAPTLTAPKATLYLRLDGSTTNDRAYINTNGTTGWTALTTAA